MIVRNLNPVRMVLLLRQIALMTSAGIPAVAAFGMVEKTETDTVIRKAVKRNNQLLRQGISLSKALEKSNLITDPMELQIVQTGEQTGSVNNAFSALADQREDQLQFKNKLLQILIYPILILLVSLAVIGLMIFWIVPGFSESYQAMGVPIPEIMNVFLSVNEFLTTNHIAVIITILSVVVIVKVLLRQKKIRQIIQGAIMKAPFFNSFMQITFNYRFCKGLELMLSSGIPLSQSLRIFKRQAGFKIFEQEVQVLIRGVESGLPLSAMIQQNTILLPVVAQMISVGEKTAGLPFILNKTSELIRLEMDSRIRLAGNLAEPLIMVVTGLLVGALLISLYIPLFESMNMIGG